MLKRFREYIRNENLIKDDQRVLIAVSGGMDSVVLAQLFYQSGFKFGIVHCNFQLRGESANEDERLVESLAGNMGVPFYSERFDTKKYAEKHKLSVQMAARELRYAYFEKLRKNEAYDCIATAHHLDDQIETFFVNILRGSGIAGLHGINVKTGRVIRPLLFARRSDIEAYCKKKMLMYREDASNQSVAYLRNKIRLKLLPVLEEINADYRSIFNNNFNTIRNIEKVYQARIDRIRGSLLTEGGDGSISISIDALLFLNPLSSLLFEILRPFSFNMAAVDQIIESLDDIPGKKFFSETHRLVKDRDELIISRLDQADEQEYLIRREDRKMQNPIRLQISVEPYDENFVLPIVVEIACLDYDSLQFPLVLRKWKEGDIIFPLGMKGRKKLSDYFIDQKFSLSQKENTWLLVSGNEIAWIVGQRISERFRITDSTARVYVVQFIK